MSAPDLLTALRDLLEALDRQGDIDGVPMPEWIDGPDGEYAGGAVTRARAALKRAACQRCGGRGYLECDDPQHGDSTWDHYCNAGATCPDCGP